MNATRMRECMAYPGWSPRETARRARRNSDILRHMARNRHGIDQALADWLEAIAAQWASLPVAAQVLARILGCANGVLPIELVRNKEWLPQLEALKNFHMNHRPPPPP